jgi:hypothetical protein
MVIAGSREHKVCRLSSELLIGVASFIQIVRTAAKKRKAITGFLRVKGV